MAATASSDAFLERLAVEEPEYWAYLQTHPSQLANVERQAEQFAAQATGSGNQQYALFITQVQSMPSWSQFTAAPPPDDETPPPPPPPAEDEDDPPLLGEDEDDSPPDNSGQDQIDRDVRVELNIFLEEWGLRGMDQWVEEMITNHYSTTESLVRLRETDEYKAAFPENAMRKENGLSWWSEAQILEYRDEARRLAQTYLGITDVTNDEIASLVAREVALPEWERRLATWKSFQQWGPAVQQALSEELGFELPDDRVWAFMNPDIPTPELDEAYDMALRRGMPESLGFGIRPEEEAQILRQFGLDPEAAFQNYQGIASELPRQSRLAMIENYINSQSNQPTAGLTLGDTSFGELFGAIQLGDPTALRNISQRMAREFARYKAGGGPIRSGTAAIGLLAPEDRQ